MLKPNTEGVAHSDCIRRGGLLLFEPINEVVPEINAVGRGLDPLLVNLLRSFTVFVLRRSILMPVPEAQRVLAKELVQHFSDLVYVILQQACDEGTGRMRMRCHLAMLVPPADVQHMRIPAHSSKHADAYTASMARRHAPDLGIPR